LGVGGGGGPPPPPPPTPTHPPPKKNKFYDKIKKKKKQKIERENFNQIFDESLRKKGLIMSKNMKDYTKKYIENLKIKNN